MKLVRKRGATSETRIVNLDAIINKGKTALDLTVEPDDTIIVPERLINF